MEHPFHGNLTLGGRISAAVVKDIASSGRHALGRFPRGCLGWARDLLIVAKQSDRAGGRVWIE